MDLSTGIATPDGNADRNVVMNPEAGDTYRAVVVPQSVASGKSIIGITIDGVTYHYNRAEGMTYTAGKLHNFTIKVDRKADGGGYALSLVSEDVTDWEADKSSHDFEANSYLVVNVPVAGTLKECVRSTGSDYSTVKNLKVTGQLTDEDFRFMREEMSMLTAVNLKEAKMVNVECRIPQGNTAYQWDWPLEPRDDVYPNNAFADKETLRRIILPENITVIGERSFSHLRLTSTVIIPEGVKRIGHWAFDSMGEEGTIVWPNSLEYIEEYAFYGCNANFELKLNNSITHIGTGALMEARGASGAFNLPAKLEFLGDKAFQWCGHDLIGDIIIPEKITEIAESAFYGIGFIQSGTNLYFHDGLKKIGEQAFMDLKIRNSISIPQNVKYIGEYAFLYANFLGSVSIPDNIAYLGPLAFGVSNLSGKIKYPSSLRSAIGGGSLHKGGAFASTQISSVEIGDNIMQIEANAFENCPELEYVEIGKNVSFIGERAFAGLTKLSTIVCLSEEPPTAQDNSFEYIEYDKAILEVPEASVDAYRNATGWKNFRNVTAHHELAFNIPEILCLDKGITREGIIQSEGAWKIVECPSWVHVTPEYAGNKENLTVTVDPLPAASGSREGKVVFKLNDKDYSTYTSIRQLSFEYSEDTEIVLQTASAGPKEIPLFIVGEGFNADEITNGNYLRIINETMEHFFSIEPFKTYRNYFTVSSAIACSPDNGVSDVINVKTTPFNSNGVIPNEEKLLEYANRVSTHVRNNISNAIIVMVSNYNNFSGWSNYNVDGCSIAGIGLVNDTYPYDQRGLVQHYAGGEAFAGLGNESVTHFEHIKGCTCPQCAALCNFICMKGSGLYENLTMSSKMSEVPWRDFIFHPKYSHLVDMWEGGYNHLRGVWRSENQSIMGTYIAYFNTISRYAIYKEIMKRSGRQPSLEDFINNDIIEIQQ